MKAGGKNPHEEEDQDQWMSNLPNDVLIEILCRLPIKTLISLKPVCKLWLNLISADTLFADFHHRRAPTELLLRSHVNDQTSTKFYLGNIQFHNDSVFDFKHNFSVRSNTCNNFGFLDGHVSDPLFANSCNGFVCFHKRRILGKLMDAVICNPVTDEFITVPGPELGNREYFHAYGLGFSGKENRYKLLRLVYAFTGGILSRCKVFAQICTFEKGSLWRNLRDCPFNGTSRCYSPLAFLEGKLHFNYYYLLRGAYIDCFDFDDEQFGKVPLPPSCHYDSTYCAIIGKIKLIGELRSCLCVSHFDVNSCFNVWAMKIYGVAESWTKLFSFNKSVSDHCFLPHFLLQMGNGEILLCTQDNRLVLYNPVLNNTRSVGLDFAFLEVIAYSPTLIPLKDALAGYEACVQNLDSR